jgi:hypothetical protein
MITRNQAVEALRVVMDINRDQRTPCNALYNYSGHVEVISISLYPYGFSKNSDRWYNFTFHTVSGKDEGYASVWDGEYMSYDEEPKYDTLDEMLKAIEAIKDVAKKGVEDGQTE